MTILWRERFWAGRPRNWQVAPALGCLDDLIIVPVGILLVAKMIPADLLAEFRAEAARLENKPKSHAGAAMIVLLWLVVAALLLWWLLPRFAG